LIPKFRKSLFINDFLDSASGSEVEKNSYPQQAKENQVAVYKGFYCLSLFLSFHFYR